MLAFARPRHEGHGVWVVAGYRRFVSKAVPEVLREWGRDVVTRVVCTIGMGTYESSTVEMDEEGLRLGLVRRVDRGMWDGSWRCA